MQHWVFIIAAFALTGIATAAVSFWSWRAMRVAESEAEGLSKRA